MTKSGKTVTFKLIAAACENMGIGNKGGLPWRLKKEMQYFTDMTTTTKDFGKKNAVVMGRKTWESIPLKYKPLSDRINVIISQTIKESGYEDVPVFRNLGEALVKLSEAFFSEIIEDIWIIGGSRLYEKVEFIIGNIQCFADATEANDLVDEEEAINSPLCDAIYLTRVQAEFVCDTFFPKIPECYQETQEENVSSEVQKENGICYQFTVLKRKQNV